MADSVGFIGLGNMGGPMALNLVKAGFEPRLSGLAEVPLDRQLGRVSRRCRLGFEETIERFSVHQVGAYEAGEMQRADDGFLGGLRQAQQQKGDQRDGDLDFDGIFAGAEEAGDPQGLLDPTEEQLDGPAALIELGDLRRRGVEIVGQDAQHFAGLGLDLYFAHRVAHRVAPAGALAVGQEADAVGQDGAVGGDGQFLDHRQRGVALEARDDAAAFLVEPGPPSIIVIAEIEDVSGTGFDGHRLRRGDVVDPCRGDRGIDRAVAIGVVDDVQLDAAHLGREARPVEAGRRA